MPSTLLDRVVVTCKRLMTNTEIFIDRSQSQKWSKHAANAEVLCATFKAGVWNFPWRGSFGFRKSRKVFAFLIPWYAKYWEIKNWSPSFSPWYLVSESESTGNCDCAISITAGCVEGTKPVVNSSALRRLYYKGLNNKHSYFHYCYLCHRANFPSPSEWHFVIMSTITLAQGAMQ